MKKIILVLLLCLLPIISVKAEPGSTFSLKCAYKYNSYTIFINYNNNTFSATSSWTKLQDKNITNTLVLANFRNKLSNGSITYSCPAAINIKVGGTDKGNNKTAVLSEYKKGGTSIKLDKNQSSSGGRGYVEKANTKSCVFSSNGAEIAIEYNYDSNTYSIVKKVLTNNRTLAPLDDTKVKSYFSNAKTNGCGSYYMTCPTRKDSVCTIFSQQSSSSTPKSGAEVKDVNLVNNELSNTGTTFTMINFTAINCDTMLSDMPETMNYLNKAFNLIKIIAPILVLIFGSLDYAKVVFSDKEDSLKKANSAFLKRIIAAAIIFLLPFLLTFLINIIPGLNTTLCGIGIE